MTDIIDRLLDSEEHAGEWAIPVVAEDAVEEIKELRRMLKEYYKYVQDNTSDRQYDEDGWLANLDSDVHLYLYNRGLGYFNDEAELLIKASEYLNACKL